MEHTTQNGTALEIQPVSQMLIERLRAKATLEFNEEHGAPTPPTYETSVGEVISHDEKSIQDENTPAAEKEAWIAYLEKRNAQIIYIQDRLAAAFLWLGVITEPQDDEWTKPLESLGVDIPDDTKERKMLWLDTVALVNQDERWKLVLRIRSLSDPVEVEAAAAAETFQH